MADAVLAENNNQKPIENQKHELEEDGDVSIESSKRVKLSDSEDVEPTPEADASSENAPYATPNDTPAGEHKDGEPPSDGVDAKENPDASQPASEIPDSENASPEPAEANADFKQEDGDAKQEQDNESEAEADAEEVEEVAEINEVNEEMADAPEAVDESSLTPLEKAKLAAERVKLEKPEDLDPEEPGAELPKHQLKYFTSAIKAIKRLKDAAPFLAPVDPVAQGVPDYFTYIKEPMDLGTMEKNLTVAKYVTVQEIIDDFNRVVGNCIIFNGEDAGISEMAKSIGQSFQKHLLNAPPYDEGDAKRRRSAPPVARAATAVRAANSPPVVTKQHLQAPGVPVIRRSSMTADGRPKRAIHPPAYRDLVDQPPKTKKQIAELKFCGTVLRELMNRKNETISYPFLQPVDPVAQGVPHYHEIIKEPMDLSTMSQKLNDGLYEGAEDFESDFRLMLQNCYVFNPEGTPVNQLGRRLENLFDRRWLEKPVPVPTPPPGASDNDSEADEYEEAGITNPAIKVLEDNIANLKQQLRKLKREALQQWREKGGKRRSKAPRRTSSAKKPKDEPITKVTYAMKKEISDKIPTLNEKKLRKVLAIIQESMPQLRNSGQDEIELDMDQLDESTQRQLYNYVVRKMEDDYNKPVAGAGAAPQKKKKSKPLTEDEQNRQIEEIQNKLAQFDQHKPGTSTPASASPAAAPAGTNNDDSSSDEERDQQSDSDDSSSEEE